METREILFRAWIPDQKMMFYQNDQYLESFLRRANLLFNGESGHPKYGTPPLMQFTGLTDRNGVKVFEGDRVKVEYSYDTLGENLGVIPDGGHKEVIAVVKINPYGVFFSAEGDGEDFYLIDMQFSIEGEIEEIEVIGHIHEKGVGL